MHDYKKIITKQKQLLTQVSAIQASQNFRLESVNTSPIPNFMISQCFHR